MEEDVFSIYVNLNVLRANRYELMEVHLFAYKDFIQM